MLAARSPGNASRRYQRHQLTIRANSKSTAARIVELEADQRQDDYDQAVAERFTNWTPPPPPPEPPRRSSRIARLAERCPPIPPQPWPWPRSTAADIVRELRSQVIELRATVARLRDGEP